ncbi:MAG: ABC transporter permease [Firmicutes bacterium]|nr:ABC transporter permease [Bacillota bacterium]
MLAVAGAVILVLLAAAAVFGPAISPYRYDQQNYRLTKHPPCWDHPFGTDELGRDMLVRVLHGARISMLVGIVSSLINLVIGVTYGAVAGFAGGRVGLFNIFIALGIIFWLTMARIVRGQILRIKQQEFVLAELVMGVPRWRIIVRHLIPNTLGPIIVYATLSIPTGIFLEAFLSFVGLGVSAPIASWGTLASDGLKVMRSSPWQLFFPAAAMSACILGFNFMGNGLRDALDPRLRK